MSEAEREGALETFFVKIKDTLDIVPAQLQVINIMQEKAVYRHAGGSAIKRILA